LCTLRLIEIPKRGPSRASCPALDPERTDSEHPDSEHTDSERTGSERSKSADGEPPTLLLFCCLPLADWALAVPAIELTTGGLTTGRDLKALTARCLVAAR